MPISIDRLENEPPEVLAVREGTQPYTVLQFLAKNDNQAYTQTEIAETTGIDRGSVGAVLSRLDDRDLVRHKGRYWAIGTDDRLAAFAAQQQASSMSTTDDYYAGEK
ncbi:MarR family transcriptional regulator [Halodesulfurarchaeum formicicum]|uniref:Transcriptional regulator n=1 Tax=Halodesulfurarchaeum formicicum TaxID=1873524 RepID=A0A1J1AEC0_9EURY|nr:helix-turn-helix domain-containing protein [Halodesulfurarchaeum formicicum]APE96486.1 transcriptional regulator [Halodesulfurarchaeum formicicum]